MSIDQRPRLSRRAATFSLPLVLVVGLFATAGSSVGAPSKNGPTPTTLPIVSVPAIPGSGSGNASAQPGKILMIKMFVGNIDTAEKFYGAVFGATLALKVGPAHIVTFPAGGPGLVLLKKGAHDKDKHAGFIIQVPDLPAAKALAVAHGARVQGTFAGNPGNQVAKSIDLLDPWGNQVEILQLG